MFIFGSKKPNQELIDGVRASAHIVHLVHQELKKAIRPGVSLLELDKLAAKVISDNGATSSFLNYNGFPAHICASVNEILVHGIPDNYILKDGDIITCDVGVYKNGYHGDAAFTVGVGNISANAKRIIDTGNECLAKVVEFIKPGITLGDLGHMIEQFATSHGYFVPKEYVGHGIGKNLHEDPIVPNYGTPGTGEKLKEGQIICVEPMLIEHSNKLFVDPIDKWTVRSIDKGLSIHVEHTILITKEGVEILNK